MSNFSKVFIISFIFLLPAFYMARAYSKIKGPAKESIRIDHKGIGPIRLDLSISSIKKGLYKIKRISSLAPSPAVMATLR